MSVSKEPGLQPRGREAFEGLKQGRGLIQLGDPIKGHSGHHVLSLPGVGHRGQAGLWVEELAGRLGLHGLDAGVSEACG